MTPDEKFYQDVWHVLQKLREASFTPEEDESFVFELPQIQGVGIFPNSVARRIVRNFLAPRERAIELVGDTPHSMRVKLLPNFDAVYKKYESMFGVTAKIERWVAKASYKTLKSVLDLVNRLVPYAEVTELFNFPTVSLNQEGLADIPMLEMLQEMKIITFDIDNIVGDTQISADAEQLKTLLTLLEQRLSEMNKHNLGETYQGKATEDQLPSKEMMLILQEARERHERIEPTPGANKALSIVTEFSLHNLPFVKEIMTGIQDAAEFTTKGGPVSYTLQSGAGEELIKERRLLKKLESYGLFRHLGEDGIYGIAKLARLDEKLLQQCLDQIRQKIELGDSDLVVGNDEDRKNDKESGVEPAAASTIQVNQINIGLKNLGWPISLQEDKEKYILSHHGEFACTFEKSQNLGRVFILFLSNPNKYLTYREIYSVTTEAEKTPYEVAITRSKNAVHHALRQNWHDIVDKKLPEDLKDKIKFAGEGNRAGKFKMIYTKSPSVNLPE